VTGQCPDCGRWDHAPECAHPSAHLEVVLGRIEAAVDGAITEVFMWAVESWYFDGVNTAEFRAEIVRCRKAEEEGEPR
jgi:hypothetical protein